MAFTKLLLKNALSIQPCNYDQSALKHGRRTFLYSAMGDGMQWATLGKSSSEAASQLQGRIARAFFQQQFGEYHGYDGCYSVYFGTSKIVRLSGLLKKSRMTILGLAGVLFCENEQA